MKINTKAFLFLVSFHFSVSINAQITCSEETALNTDNIDITYKIGSTTVAGTTEDNPGNASIDVVFGSKASDPELSLLEYEALVYDNKDCSGAAIDTISISVDDSTKSAPVVRVIVPSYNIMSPGNIVECGDYFDGSDSFWCHEFHICVQLQTNLCGEPITSKGVNVEAVFDIETGCNFNDIEWDVDFPDIPPFPLDCVSGIIKHDVPADVMTDTDAGFPVAAYDCDAGINGDAVYLQGQPANACVALDPDISGVCILDIVSLDLVLEDPSISYQILPFSFGADLGANPFLVPNSIDYSPSFDDDAASIHFQFFQYRYGDEVAEQINNRPLLAHFEGLAILGFGANDCNDLRRRYLQDGENTSNGPIPVTFSGASFDLTVHIPAVVPYDCDAGIGSNVVISEETPMNVCLVLTPSNPDSCISAVGGLSLVVGDDSTSQSMYDILSNSVIDYNPPLPVGPNGATVQFTPTNEIINSITPEKIAHFEGAATVSHGCVCTGSTSCSDENAKFDNYIEGVLFFSGEEQVFRDSDVISDPTTQDDCGIWYNIIFCLFSKFINSIMALFGF